MSKTINNQVKTWRFDLGESRRDSDYVVEYDGNLTFTYYFAKTKRKFYIFEVDNLEEAQEEIENLNNGEDDFKFLMGEMRRCLDDICWDFGNHSVEYDSLNEMLTVYAQDGREICNIYPADDRVYDMIALENGSSPLEDNWEDGAGNVLSLDMLEKQEEKIADYLEEHKDEIKKLIYEACVKNLIEHEVTVFDMYINMPTNDVDTWSICYVGQEDEPADDDFFVFYEINWGELYDSNWGFSDNFWDFLDADEEKEALESDAPTGTATRILLQNHKEDFIIFFQNNIDDDYMKEVRGEWLERLGLIEVCD